MNRRSTIFWAILAVCITAGCNTEVRTKRAPAQAIGRFLAAAQSMNSTQQALALDVCLALRSKNTLFRSEMNGHKFVFDLKHTSCSGDRFESSIEAFLKVPSETTSPLQWTANSNKFFTFEDTHEHGQLAAICPDIIKGQSVSNTYETNDGTRAQVTFSNSSANGGQSYSVTTAKNDGKGQYVVYKQDDYQVVTGSVPQNAYVGIFLSHVQTVPCANGGTETLSQAYRHD